jgi:hypothetical protein
MTVSSEFLKNSALWAGDFGLFVPGNCTCTENDRDLRPYPTREIVAIASSMILYKKAAVGKLQEIAD